MPISNLFPTIKPSLNLDFANVKELDPRITFTRASAATYYDGVTTAKAEENLLLQSQTFGSASWTKFFVTITSNNATAPDSSNTATLYTTNGSGQYLRQATAQAVSTTYTYSIFAKAGTLNWLCLRNNAANNNTNAYAWFNLSTGALGTAQSGITSAIMDAGNGWYRCSVTGNTLSTITNNLVDVYTATADASTTPGNGNIYIWGAQLEQRSSVSAYTTTTAQQIINYIPKLQTSANNSVRFDHNPISGEILGSLFEEQRTNLLTYSEQFDNGIWQKVNSRIIANNVVAPDGTLSGDKIIGDTVNTSHSVRYGVTTTATVHTFSIYLKKAELFTGSLLINDNAQLGNSISTTFDLNAGTLSGTSASGTFTGASATISEVGNQWYRVCLTGTFGTGSVTCRIYTPTGVNDNYSGFYIWGAQLEQGNFVTSYIPSVASQATRAAEYSYITGTNFSNWYNQGEGTFVITSYYARGSTPSLVATDDGTTSNRNILYIQGQTQPTIRIVNNDAEQISSGTLGTINANTFFTCALSYKSNDCAGSSNGAAVVTDSDVVIPGAQSFLRIGSNVSGSAFLNGYIRRLSYYPKRLTNEQLQTLTL